MKILVINSGSSSIKYQLFDMEANEPLAGGVIERIGEETGHIKHTVFKEGEKKEISQDVAVENHHQGLEQATRLLLDEEIGVISRPSEIAAIGHRLVHGGETFGDTTLIDEAVKTRIKELSFLAPLHNPPTLQGVEVAEQLFPEARQVGVFDTAFHQTMPPRAYRYAIPTRFYEDHGVRAYGMHGTSHLYVTKAAIDYLGRAAAETNLITIHLGNGCSMTAVEGGQSVETSMGFSPLPGLMMGTRSGDIDPTVGYFMGTQLGMSFEEIDRTLNKESGLLGVCGHIDLRDIQALQEQGNAEAQLALEMYTYRIKKYIGAYLAVLGRVDALVFTAGVGENSAYVRGRACQGLENLGVVLDAEKNEAPRLAAIQEIQSAYSTVKILVIPTNEELEIARQTLEIIKG